MPTCECGTIFSDSQDAGPPWTIDAHRTTCMYARLAVANARVQQLELRNGEMHDQIVQAYAAMGNYLHEAFGWEKKQEGEYLYAFTIRKFIEVVNNKFEETNKLVHNLEFRVSVREGAAKALAKDRDEVAQLNGKLQNQLRELNAALECIERTCADLPDMDPVLMSIYSVARRGLSFVENRICTGDMKCPLSGHYHPQDPDLDEQT